MKLLKKLHKKESGQAFILVLILLVVGGLIIAPLLGFMSTGLIAGQASEKRMAEVYAADAGIEDAIYNIITPGAPVYQDLQDLDDGASHPYTLTDPVNGETVDVTITKLSLIQGLLAENEYKLNRPHENWLDFVVPPGELTQNYGEGWVEYTASIDLYYDKPSGAAPRSIQTAGAFFLPPPGSEDLITSNSPYDWQDGSVTPWGVITFDQLQTDSPETKIAAGGFAFIWRWEQNNGPEFSPQDTGGFSFKFKINDPDWEPYIYFAWATVKQQDISYITSEDLWKWLVEATAGGTAVQSAILAGTDVVDILTWEIDTQ